MCCIIELFLTFTYKVIEFIQLFEQFNCLFQNHCQVHHGEPDQKTRVSSYFRNHAEKQKKMNKEKECRKDVKKRSEEHMKERRRKQVKKK